MALKHIRIGGRQSGTGTPGALRTTTAPCACGHCSPRPKVQASNAPAATSGQAADAGRTEREAADVLHVAMQENTPAAQRVIAAVARMFPKLAARVAAERSTMPAPKQRSFADAIRERTHGPAPRATASPSRQLSKPLPAPVDKPVVLAPLRVPSMVERILAKKTK